MPFFADVTHAALFGDWLADGLVTVGLESWATERDGLGVVGLEPGAADSRVGLSLGEGTAVVPAATAGVAEGSEAAGLAVKAGTAKMATSAAAATTHPRAIHDDLDIFRPASPTRMARG